MYFWRAGEGRGQTAIVEQLVEIIFVSESKLLGLDHRRKVVRLVVYGVRKFTM